MIKLDGLNMDIMLRNANETVLRLVVLEILGCFGMNDENDENDEKLIIFFRMTDDGLDS